MVYTTTACDGSIRYTASFLIKRFARVWPVYVVAVLADLLLARMHLISTAKVFPPLLAILKSLVFIPIDASKAPFFDTPYDVGWTLNFELYFYLVFGLSMLFGRHRWKALSTWFVFTLVAIPLIASGHVGLDVRQNYGITHAYIALISNPIVWEFAVGVVIARLYLGSMYLPRRPVTYVLIVSTIVFAAWYDFTWHGTFNGLDQWGAPLPLALLVLALASKRVHFQVPAVLVWLGGISYSLYLFHPLASEGLQSLMSAVSLGRLIPTWWCAAAVTVFAIAIASIANVLLEDGLSTWVRHRLFAFLDSFDRRDSRSANRS